MRALCGLTQNVKVWLTVFDMVYSMCIAKSVFTTPLSPMLYYIYGRKDERKDEEGTDKRKREKTTEAVRAAGICTNDV